MFTFYSKHLTFNHQDKDILKKQVKEAYQAGLDGAQKVEAIDAAAAKAKANVAALEKTQTLFPGLDPGNSLMKLTTQALEQERKWLAHYEKCVAETKRGYEKLLAASKALREEAFVAGSLHKEKELKAARDKERAAAARAEAEKQQQQQNKNKQQQGQNGQNNGNNNNGNNNGQNNGNNNGQKKGVTLVVENMIVKGRDTGKKKDKKKKGDKTFWQLS